MKKLAFLFSMLVCVALVSCQSKADNSDNDSDDDKTENVKGGSTSKDAASADEATSTAADYVTLEKLLDVAGAPGDVDVSKPLVIDFNATWCGPCKRFAPVYGAVSLEYSDKATFWSVDVDEYPEIAKLYSFQGIPCVVITFPAAMGREPVLTQGAMDEEQFKAFLNNNL